MMSEAHPARRAFAALVALPDDAIDLAQASLLIAREEYPDLEVGRYLARLDEMAAAVGQRLRGGEGATSRIAHLNRLLFDELGLRRRARNNEMLERMRNDLKAIYQGQRDFHRAQQSQELLVCVSPASAREIRDRGLIRVRLALLAQAADDLGAYLDAAPDAPDAA